MFVKSIFKRVASPLVLNHLRNCSNTSNSMYTVDEIRIPIPSIEGHLAGKLWKGSQYQNSRTPIICMHGLQDNAGSFDSLIPLIIKDDMTLFAVDLPGHGLSSHTKELYYNTLFDGLSTIQRVQKHFNWDKVTFLSHSLGSIISYIFCSIFSDKVDRYIAIENLRPVPRNNPTHSFQNAINKMFEIEEKLLSETKRPSYIYEDILERTISSRKNTVTEEGCKLLLKRGAEKVIVDGVERYRFTHDIKTNIPVAYRMLSEVQTDHLSANITVPVCVIKGEPGEDYEPRENYLKSVDALSKTAERLEFHLVPGTHHVHLNEPHLVAPIICKFLE